MKIKGEREMEEPTIPEGVKRIMIVDDDPEIVELISEALEHKSYDIETASGGRECLDKVDGFKPDMILLDIMMPGMSGWEVLDELGARGLGEQIKVAMLTAKPLTEKDTKRINFPNLVHYINKPIILGDFFQDIEDIFREELMVAKEAKKLAEFGGDKFAEGYGEVLTQNLRRRRIFSSFLETKDSLDILKTHLDLDELIRTTEDVQKKLNKIKKYFNPVVYFFCFGIEKELARIENFARGLQENRK